MPNVQAGRDDNYVVSGLGVDDTDVTITEPLFVDPSTSRLQVAIQQTSDAASPTAPGTAPRDENFVVVGMGVTDDANLTPTPIFVDVRSGYLWVDAVAE